MTHTNTEALSDDMRRAQAVMVPDERLRHMANSPAHIMQSAAPVSLKSGELRGMAEELLSRRSAGNTGGVEVKAQKALPDRGILRELFAYDPDTGIVTRRLSGEEAFTSTDRHGYRFGKVGETNYQAHRVIWKMVHGADPNVIDHANGDRSDNRLINLRDCTVADNSRNSRKAPGSTSKYRGVSWVKRDHRWAARISDGKGGKFSLGNHPTEEAAARAYDSAAREFHGEYAVLNFPDEVSK